MIQPKPTDMKPFILLMFFVITFCGYSQKKITIDFNSSVILTSYIVEKNEEIELSFVSKSGTYIMISYTRDYNPQGTLNIPDAAAGNVQIFGSPSDPIKMTFGANTKYTFTLKTYKQADNSPLDTFTVEFVSRSKWYWTPTFGISVVALANRDTYKSLLNSDGSDPATYTIVRDGSQKQYEGIPSVMFTYSMLESDFSIGFTGGLGTDFETLSTFVGLSGVIGQNFVVTAGLAFHEQLRLDSKYDVGQVVDSNLSFTDLNTVYYRFNPFISLTYRLNTNPYKK